jgi:hypothetical protein
MLRARIRKQPIDVHVAADRNVDVAD